MPTDVPGDVAGLDDTLSVPPDSRPREPDPESTRRIGPYRLLHLIGEGGMGEVWVAEQLEPVRRKVALKVIKAGMDTKQVVARFEAERQALALMDHRAIAKVLDGGATPEGRPYFVMEYVAGVPITEHCDRHKLPTDERLRLLMEVCEGVQHAHQKAIIHRDLKPSNILVSLVDGHAQPKIIDFGIAKATAQRLTEKTLFTEVGSVIGTPEYMSPEQADLTGQDIDTRTDVYSLGVLLYQLLTGELPFDSKKLRSSSYEELRRTLREVEPEKPSATLARRGGAAEDAAKLRRSDAPTLRRQLEGDLDAITLKALEKDCSRRYGTPSELVADIERHLHNEPVVARPPSRSYRLQKYLRRHQTAVLLGAGLLLLLSGFAGVTTMQARRLARAERERANQKAEAASKVMKFATEILQAFSATEQELGRKEIEVLLSAQWQESSMPSGNPVNPVGLLDGKVGARSTMTREALLREILDRASKTVDRELQGHPEEQAQLMRTLAMSYERLGLVAQARTLLTRAVETQLAVFGKEHYATLVFQINLAYHLMRTRDFPAAEKVAREILETELRLGGSRDQELTLRSMSLLGLALRGEGRLAEAEKLQRESLALKERVFGPENLGTLRSVDLLSVTLAEQGLLEEALKLHRETAETRRRVWGPGTDDWLTALTKYQLACVLARASRREEALSFLRDAVDHGLDERQALNVVKDEALTSLHGDPRFDAIVADVLKRVTPPIEQHQE